MAPTKRGTLNTIAVLVIVLLSIGGGFAVQRIMRSYRLKEYPKNYEEAVSAYSAENRIPDYVVYASIKVRSDFDASLRSDDGRTGLFQLTDLQFYDLSDSDEESDPRLLYDPDCSIRLGCSWISSLYEKYGDWTAVWAAMYAGEEKVDGWMTTDKGGVKTLASIPDRATAEYAEKTDDAVKTYRSLYSGGFFE